MDLSKPAGMLVKNRLVLKIYPNPLLTTHFNEKAFIDLRHLNRRQPMKIYIVLQEGEIIRKGQWSLSGLAPDMTAPELSFSES